MKYDIKLIELVYKFIFNSSKHSVILCFFESFKVLHDLYNLSSFLLNLFIINTSSLSFSIRFSVTFMEVSLITET